MRKIIRPSSLVAPFLLHLGACQSQQVATSHPASRPATRPTSEPASQPQSRPVSGPSLSWRALFSLSKREGNRSFLIAYDAWDIVPIDPKNPFSTPPPPTKENLEKELLAAPQDAARSASIRQALAMMESCEREKIPYSVARAARSRKLSSTLLQRGSLVTDVLFCFPISEENRLEADSVRVGYQRRQEIEGERLPVRAYQVIDGEVTLCKEIR